MKTLRTILKYLALGAAIALANGLVYRQSLSFAPVHLDEQQLLSDKWQYLKTNKAVRDAFKQDVFSSGNGSFYRPTLTLSFIADARLYGNKFDLAPFHRTNLLLHILNALLCFILLARLAYVAELAAAGALLFSLHPALAGACGWVPGRNDSVLFLFTILALIFLTESAKRRSAAFFMLHLVSFFLALLTKETAVGLLPLFPAWVYFLHRETALKGKWKLKTAVAALCWAACAGLYLFLRTGALKDSPANIIPGMHDLFFRTAAYISYTFLPVKVPVFAWFKDLTLTRLILSCSAGLVLFAAAWLRPALWPVSGLRAGKWRKGLILPGALAAMVLFILPSAFSDRFIPHRLYLPVFFCALAVTEAARLFYPAKRAITLALMAAAALCMAWLTFNSLDRYRNPDTFWGDAHAASPSCGEAAYELGYSAQLRGDLVPAEKYYLEVISGSPYIPDARLNLGVIYKQAGRYGEAMRLYEGELKLVPGKTTVIENMGNLLAAKGDCAKAIVYYKQKIALDPGTRKTYESLIGCLLRTGNEAEAAKYARIAKTLSN